MRTVRTRLSAIISVGMLLFYLYLMGRDRTLKTVEPNDVFNKSGMLVILDARGKNDSRDATLSTNAQCWLSRTGLLNPQCSPVTLLASSQEAVKVFNARWFRKGGCAAHAVVGDREAGRTLMSASLAAGRGFVLTYPGDVWLGDARNAVFASAAGGTGSHAGVHVDMLCDIALAAAKAGKRDDDTFGVNESSRLLAVRPTVAGRAWFKAAVACETDATRSNGVFYRGWPHSDTQSAQTLPIISFACITKAHNVVPMARVCTADRTLITPSLLDFDTDGPASTGLWPVLISTHDAEPGALVTRGLWAVGKSQDTCADDPGLLLDQGALSAALQPPHPVHPSAVHLRVRILTMARPASLQRLLASLLAADYLPDAVIPLEIAVDVPGSAADAETAAAHTRTLAIVSSVVWPYGPLSLDVASKSRGLAAQWLGWRPTRGDEACLVLEDDVEVGPGWYTWAVPLLAQYWAGMTPGLADRGGRPASAARLAAISLSYQNKVVGEVSGSAQTYGKSQLGEMLSANGTRTVPYYLAAQASSWAPILLPRPWLHFLDWYGRKDGRLALPSQRDGLPSPCLPGLASNKWWVREQRPGGIWTAWWHAFTVRTGYVVLYVQPDNGIAPQAINHKEPGMHFHKKLKADGRLKMTKAREGVHTAPVSQPPWFDNLPVYDLHMRPQGLAGGPGGVRALSLRSVITGGFGDGSCE